MLTQSVPGDRGSLVVLRRDSRLFFPPPSRTQWSFSEITIELKIRRKHDNYADGSPPCGLGLTSIPLAAAGSVW